MQHTITMQRPKFDSKRGFYEPHCACGWRSTPLWRRGEARQAALDHIVREWDHELYAVLGEHADRNDDFNYSAWKRDHPKPTLESIP